MHGRNLPQPMVYKCVTLTYPDNKTLSLQLTSVLPVTCYVSVLWPELWLQSQSDHWLQGCSGVCRHEHTSVRSTIYKLHVFVAMAMTTPPSWDGFPSSSFWLLPVRTLGVIKKWTVVHIMEAIKDWTAVHILEAIKDWTVVHIMEAIKDWTAVHILEAIKDWTAVHIMEAIKDYIYWKQSKTGQWYIYWQQSKTDIYWKQSKTGQRYI